MLATVVFVALVGAIVARRITWVRDRLPPPASTALTGLAATVTAALLAGTEPGPMRAVAAGIATAAGGALLIGAAGAVAHAATRAIRERELTRLVPSVRGRVEERVDRSRLRIRGWNIPAVLVRSVLRASDVRITGLAAEMSYYALISLVPIATALGSSLGFLRRLLGDAQVEEIRTSIVEALTSIFAQQVASDVLAPLVDGLLDEGRTSVAIGALLITLYLASRVFRAAVRALNDAYKVPARHHVIAQYALGLVLTIGGLVALVTIVLLIVVGPLLGGGAALAEAFGLSDLFRLSWEVLRWPVAFGLGLVALTFLYRYAPNVTTTWRRCLPGAVVGTLGLLLVSTGFALYVRVFAPDPVGADTANAAVVQAAAQMLSLVLAGVLWLWLASIVVLLGGIVNAEIDDLRGADTSPKDDDAADVGPSS